jgi:AcrR family transcriptional regulator
MTGLRAKQKIDRHARILDAAATLFRESGYDAVKMEHIADLAELSIGTIYNYYENKGDLLMAIVAMEVGDVLASGEAVVAKPPANANKAIEALISNYIEHSLHYLSKEMWRQAMAIAIQQPSSPFGLHYAALDIALARQTSRLIKKLQKMELCAENVNAKALGELIFNNTNMMFIGFVKDEKMTTKKLLSDIRKLISPVIDALY